jgi:SH3-like domain-containing protein
MKPTRPAHLCSAVLVLFLACGCTAESEPAIDRATVISNNTSVRIDSSGSSRTLFLLSEGARVEIIGKEGSWYRVRDVEQIEGWMEESTVILDATREAMAEALAASADRPVQTIVRTTDATNLRLEPSRESDVVRRLRRGTDLAMLDRKTTPRPNSDATDIWYQVRLPEEQEIGWVYYQLVEFETPDAVEPYMEGRTYIAYQLLTTTDDPEVGPRDWFVVAERRGTTDPRFAFDGIRVFIWNLNLHRYDTTLRLRDLQGLLPLERTGTANDFGFRFHVLGDSGESVAREYRMVGTLAREVR